MALALAEGVAESPHALAGVVCDGRKSGARWMSRLVPGAPAVARAAEAPVVWVHTADDLDQVLRDLELDLLLCGDFGFILPPEALTVPRLGCVNAHWSLLPAHRGPDPAGAAIRAGDDETGLSFHTMERRIDAGNLLDQVSFAIGPTDTCLTVYANAATLARGRVGPLLDRLEGGDTGVPMDLSLGSYERRARHEDVEVDLSWPARDIDRLVRGCTSPMAWVRWNGHEVNLSRTSWRPGDGGPPGTVVSRRPVEVSCGDGILTIHAAWTSSPPWLWPPPWPLEM